MFQGRNYRRHQHNIALDYQTTTTYWGIQFPTKPVDNLMSPFIINNIKVLQNYWNRGVDKIFGIK